jgi:hypothetical protein
MTMEPERFVVEAAFWLAIAWSPTHGSEAGRVVEEAAFSAISFCFAAVSSAERVKSSG